MRELPAVSHSDTIDVADVARTIRRQWHAVAFFLAVGIVGAIAIILFAPKRYEGEATVLARSGGASGGSILGRMSGGISELLGGGAGGLAGASLETELQMLRSRALAGQAVDSLRLQVSVREPQRVPPHQIVERLELAPAFFPRDYEFTRASNGSWSVSGDSVARTAVPGQPVRLEVGTLTLARELPPEFTLRVFDREDAITRVEKRLKAAKAGGEVAKITYRGENPVTAAAVPNAIVAFYLERRKTVDRGTNQRRLEYVTEQVDRTAAELAAAESDLRKYQESTGMFDAAVVGTAQLEATGLMRAQLIELQVDEGAINQLIAQADGGQITSRDLAAYPSFIRGNAVSPLVTQLSELEVQRTRLLERRTERDPEVQALDKSIAGISASIVGIARSYASSISKQRAEFERRLGAIESDIRAIPAANERVGRLQRDVLRLTQLYTALQAQLVEARLGAIGEGGDVRPIDFAPIPKKPAFPDPIVTLGVGTGGGLMLGLIAALLLGWFGRWVRDPADVERLTGIAAHRVHANAPLLVAGAAAPRTVLVVPLERRAESRVVAERLARTASTRALPVNVLDLSNANGGGTNGSHADVATQIAQLEQRDGMVVVQLPELSDDTTIAALRENRPVVLVAPPGPVDRVQLTTAVETLRRLGVPCAGIVMSEAPPRIRLRALS